MSDAHGEYYAGESDENLSESDGNEDSELDDDLLASEDDEKAYDVSVSRRASQEINDFAVRWIDFQEPDNAVIASSNPPRANAPVAQPGSDRVDSSHARALGQVERQQAGASQEDRNYNLNRWMLLFGVISAVSGVGAFIYEVIKGQESGNPDPSVPKVIDDNVRKLVELWGTGQDTAFWNHLADYVDNVNADTTLGKPLTLGDQVLFMGYTIDLWPNMYGWIWPSTTSRAQVVQDIVEAYQARRRTGDMYRFVTTYTTLNASTQQKQIMPRAIAASQLRVALAVVGSPS